MNVVIPASKVTKRDMRMLRKTTRKLVYAMKYTPTYDEKAEAIARQIHQNYEIILEQSLKEAMAQRRLC